MFLDHSGSEPLIIFDYSKECIHMFVDVLFYHKAKQKWNKTVCSQNSHRYIYKTFFLSYLCF